MIFTNSYDFLPKSTVTFGEKGVEREGEEHVCEVGGATVELEGGAEEEEFEGYGGEKA